MENVPFQNSKNWASYKCLVKKKGKDVSGRKVFLKIWNVEFQKWPFLCSYVPD